MMADLLKEKLSLLEHQGLCRTLKTRRGPCGRAIEIDGVWKVNFCSNDYLGLANDPRLNQSASDALGAYGCGSGASRLVMGNTDLSEALEQDLAQMTGQEECLVFNSGYCANTGIIPALVGRGDIVLSDKLNHASIIDGAILSRAELKRYPHLDMGALEEDLKAAAGYRRRLIVTDTVFSMDGDRAPLDQIVDLASKHDAWVMVDEAHGFGVLGKNGTGLVEEMGLMGEVDVQMGTLSKAAGSFGAFVTGKAPLRSFLINHARSFIYTTGLPAPMIAASKAAAAIIRSQEGQIRREKVMGHAARLRQGLNQLGFDTMQSTTPIIPVVLKSAESAVEVSRRLFELGFHISAIRPPTVPVNTARLRITVTAAHTADDIDALLGAMQKV